VARFAESDGFELDAIRPEHGATAITSSVVQRRQALDRFVREQLAGDELYPETPTPHRDRFSTCSARHDGRQRSAQRRQDASTT